MISFPWKKRRRAQHKSPPLRVVREERDEARRELGKAKANLLNARLELQHVRMARDYLLDQNAYLRGRVALLENALAVSVPAPMDLPDMVWKPKPSRRPERSAKVVPLHQAPLGGRRA
jgi:hypothetical protein